VDLTRWWAHSANFPHQVSDEIRNAFDHFAQASWGRRLHNVDYVKLCKVLAKSKTPIMEPAKSSRTEYSL
jgi:hypothetical protein